MAHRGRGKTFVRSLTDEPLRDNKTLIISAQAPANGVEHESERQCSTPGRILTKVHPFAPAPPLTVQLVVESNGPVDHDGPAGSLQDVLGDTHKRRGNSVRPGWEEAAKQAKE